MNVTAVPTGLWGAVCNITNSVDRIQFCPTEYNSVRQNTLLSDRIVFCRQNTILSYRIQFCPTEYNSVRHDNFYIKHVYVQLNKVFKPNII